MSTSTTNELLEKQNEMITELIAITRDCVNACRLVLQSRQVQEIRKESQNKVDLLNGNFRRPYIPTNQEAQEAMKKARALFVQGRSRSEISKELDIPYSTVCQCIRGYYGRYFEPRSSDPNYDPNWEDAALQLLREDKTRMQISQHLKVPYLTVCDALRNKGKKREKIRRVSTSTWAERARELYTKMGQSVADISVILNVPYSSVYTVLRRDGSYRKHARKGEKANANNP